MKGENLKTGMKVKNGNTIIEVTSIPSLDKYGECFFSGKIIESTDDYYKTKIGVEFKGNWNSAFSYQV